MDGINGYIEICKLGKEYDKTKMHEVDESKRYDKMKNTLKEMYQVLKTKKVTKLLPAIVVNDVKESISNAILAVDDLSVVLSDTELTDLEKEKKLKKAENNLEKAEKTLVKVTDNAFYSFISSMRLEKTINSLGDAELESVKKDLDEATSKGYLTIEEKDAIVEEINDITAEKTSKLEDRGAITEHSVLEEYNMDVDASKVSVSEGKKYRSSVIYASISRRLQQLSQEIADLQGQRGLTFEQAVELQTKLLEQAELTKGLIKFKKTLKVNLKDISLERINKKIQKTENKLQKLSDRNNEKYSAKIDKYQNKLVELQRKQGNISYEIKKDSIIKISKKATKIRNKNSKKAFRRIKARKSINEGKLLNVNIAAIPARIRIKRQTKFEEEAQNRFTR